MRFYRRLATAGMSLMLAPFMAFANEASNASEAVVSQAADNTVALGVEGINRHTGDDDPACFISCPGSRRPCRGVHALNWMPEARNCSNPRTR